MNFEVHKFDNIIFDQCYLGTRRYFFNKSNFLRYFTDNRCCHDHPQVKHTLSYAITLKWTNKYRYEQVLKDIQFIVEHHNINRSIWIRSSCGFSFWSINGWSYRFYCKHPYHYPFQWRYVPGLGGQTGVLIKSVENKVWFSILRSAVIFHNGKCNHFNWICKLYQSLWSLWYKTKNQRIWQSWWRCQQQYQFKRKSGKHLLSHPDVGDRNCQQQLSYQVLIESTISAIVVTIKPGTRNNRILLVNFSNGLGWSCLSCCYFHNNHCSFPNFGFHFWTKRRYCHSQIFPPNILFSQFQYFR